MKNGKKKDSGKDFADFRNSKRREKNHQNGWMKFQA